MIYLKDHTKAERDLAAHRDRHGRAMFMSLSKAMTQSSAYLLIRVLDDGIEKFEVIKADVRERRLAGTLGWLERIEQVGHVLGQIG